MDTFEEYAAALEISLIDYAADDDMLSAVALFYAVSAERLEDGRLNGLPMILDVHVVKDPALNALAGTFGDTDFIAVNSGAFRILRALVRKVSCSRRNGAGRWSIR